MNEEMALEMLAHIRSHAIEIVTLDSKLEQYKQVIEWAEQSERWDLVIDLVDALCYFFAFSRSALNAEQDKEQLLETVRSFWQNGKEFSIQGLVAAQQIESQDAKIQFLEYLAQFAARLGDFDTALDCMQQQIHWVTPDIKWGVAYRLFRLGQQASYPEQRATSNALFRSSLEIFQELNDRSAMADALFCFGRNELEQGNLSIAKQYFERSINAGNHSGHLLPVIHSLQWLGKAYLIDGDIEQARSAFKRGLSMVDGLANPSADILRRNLSEALASLDS